MVVSPRPWLIDKSALVRIGAAPDAHVWADRIERGLVRIATVTLLETGYSTRTAADLAELLDLPRSRICRSNTRRPLRKTARCESSENWPREDSTVHRLFPIY